MANITLVHACDIQRRVDPGAAEGDFRDIYLDSINPTSNWGEAAIINAGISGSKPDFVTFHGLHLYDLNAFLPASASIVSASLWLMLSANNGYQAYHSYQIDRITRTDWVELEATWNIYKTGSNWTTPGGDFSTPAVVFGAIAGTGWKNWDVTTMVTDAWDNRSGICTFLLRRNDGSPSEVAYIVYFSKERQDPGGIYQAHHLRVTYTLAGRTHQAFVRDMGVLLLPRPWPGAVI